MQNGKGDSYRKKTISEEVWKKNWNKIFKKKEEVSEKKKHK